MAFVVFAKIAAAGEGRSRSAAWKSTRPAPVHVLETPLGHLAGVGGTTSGYVGFALD